MYSYGILYVRMSYHSYPSVRINHPHPPGGTTLIVGTPPPPSHDTVEYTAIRFLVSQTAAAAADTFSSDRSRELIHNFNSGSNDVLALNRDGIQPEIAQKQSKCHRFLPPSSPSSSVPL